MATAGSIVVDLLMKTGSFETDTKRAEKRLRDMTKAATAAGKVLGAALATGAIAATAAIKASINAMDDMSKAALRANMPTEDFSQLAYAGSLADVAMQDLTNSMGKLAKAQGDAQRGLVTQVESFEQLGIAFAETDGSLRSTKDVFLDFADAFQKHKGSPEVMAAGMNVFGRSFQKLIPLMKDGRAGLEAAANEADRLGITLGTEAGQQAEEFNDNLTRLKTAALGLSQAVATDLLPDLIKLSEELLGTATEGDKLRDTASAIADVFRWVGGQIRAAQSDMESLSKDVEILTNFLGGLKDMAVASFDALKAVFSLDSDAMEKAISKYADALNRVKVAATNDGTVEFNPALGRDFQGVTSDSSFSSDRWSGVSGSVSGTWEPDAPKLPTDDPATSTKARTKATKELTEAEKLYQEVMEVNAEIDQMAAQYQTDLTIAAGDRMVAEDEANKARAEAFQRQLGDMQFEIDLLGMSNKERERAIALRYANVDAASAEGQAILDMADALFVASENAALMDDVKAGLSDMFVDFISGAKSAKEAFGDFADMLFARALEFVADKAIQSMFDAFSGKGGGGSGGSSGSGGGFDWGALIGSFFGGAKASGGDVLANRPVLTGEGGREIFWPRSAGTIIPAAQTAAMTGGGSGFNQTLQFALAAPTDPRTQQQIAQRVGFETQRASNRNR